MKVIKIGAIWCNLCNVMKPRWKEIESTLPWLKTKYLDFDQDNDKIKKYSPDENKLPVAIFLDKDEQEFNRMYGEISKQKLIDYIENNKNK